MPVVTTAKPKLPRLMQFCPLCVYCHTGYTTYLLGPRGGVHAVYACVSCGRLPLSKSSGYIPLKAPRSKPRKRTHNADEVQPQA